MTVIEQRQQQVKNYVGNNTQRKYDITSQAYQNFINSLKTQATKQTYSFMLNEYLVDNNIDLNTLLNLPVRDTEQLLINYIERAKSNDKSHSFLNNMFCAIKHFYIMNDIHINKEKIGKFLGESGRKNTDRAYTYDEIKKILDVADLRMKSVILLMASTGMRIGAIPDLKLKHLQEIKGQGLYKITVYEKSKDQYYTFCSYECASTIRSYLDFRTKCGEILDGGSYLIREQFDINDFEQIRKQSRKISHNTFKQNLQSLLIKAGLRQINHNYASGYRSEIPMSHGFRKFWMNQAVKSKMPAEQRELLLGHRIGLASAYYRPSESEMLDAYLIAVDNLTINEENRLKRKVEKLEVEKSLMDQLRAEVFSIKQEMAKHKQD